MDIPTYTGYASMVTSYVAMQQKQDTKQCFKQSRSRGNLQHNPPLQIRNHILHKLPTPVRADTLETYLQGCDPE